MVKKPSKKAIAQLSDKAVALANLGRYPEAIKIHQRVLELDPDNVQSLNGMGAACDNHYHDFEKGIPYLKKALGINPHYKKALYNLGKAYANTGRFLEGIAYYDKALEIDPKDVSAWYNRGNAFWRIRKYKEALHSYEKALEIDPTDKSAIYNKYITLDKLERAEEKSRKDMMRAQRLNATPRIVKNSHWRTSGRGSTAERRISNEYLGESTAPAPFKVHTPRKADLILEDNPSSSYEKHVSEYIKKKKDEYNKAVEKKLNIMKDAILDIKNRDIALVEKITAIKKIIEGEKLEEGEKGYSAPAKLFEVICALYVKKKNAKNNDTDIDVKEILHCSSFKEKGLKPGSTFRRQRQILEKIGVIARLDDGSGFSGKLRLLL